MTLVSLSPKRRIGLDSQTLFGMPPLEHVRLAIRSGCDFVSLAYGPAPWKLDRFAPWSLREEPILRRELQNMLQDNAMGLELAEGFVIRAGRDIADCEADLDMFAQLGARKVATVTMEADASRALDQLALLFSLAKQRDLQVAFEYAPPHTFNTLAAVCDAICKTGAGNVGVLLDAMHFYRCGGVLTDLEGLPVPISYLQFSDAPVQGFGGDYYKEASFRRMIPGRGELDLIGLLSVLPDDIAIGLEVPMQDRLDQGEVLEDIVEELVAETRGFITSHPERS